MNKKGKHDNYDGLNEAIDLSIEIYRSHRRYLI